ncbi:redox-sensing transcriptional repressor Rex [Persicirhabdus sediminis]|uniref:Redox-sensing transcriptional repressor Rex n=1 Tax=Persicirhabdus sediminis TaxID=454144 RepID=A0A8J7MEK8_9BACT|nr:redox-sensing transcriptional repressor Rex [Persicirhabdus sediminis]MBK1791258.1 redox-sensing transcriptional repressor Rex [Persicirhabdus sediminis]
MADKPEISRKAVYRLSIYSRCLEQLIDDGRELVSSTALAAAAGVKSSQLRRDLAYFGQFGMRGKGYQVEGLYQAIREGLGSDRESLKPVILVGAGNLGRALLCYDGFRKEGFEVKAVFDVAADELRDHGIQVPLFHEREMLEFVRENKINMAILCVPAEAAAEVVADLVAAGIQGILNFSPAVLKVPKSVVVSQVDLASELENLSYFISQKKIFEE